ncbi:MAG: hypothetical protein HFJ14_04780, partial [Clostridium sp.]
LTDEGTYVKVRAVLKYASVSSKNTISARVEYKTKSSTTWTNAGSITSGKEVVIGGGKIDANTSYDIRLVVQDAFETVIVPMTIPTATTTLDFRNGGMGIAIGKVAEKDGLEVDWLTYYNRIVEFNKMIKVKSDSSTLENSYWLQLLRSDNSRAIALSTSENGTGMRVHTYNKSGAWASHYVFGENGVLEVNSIYASNVIRATGNNKHLQIGTGTGDVYLFNSKSGGYLQFYDDKTLRIDGVVVGEAKYPVMDRNTSKWHTRLAPVMSDGVMEIGRYIDFHKDNSSTADYNVRLDATGTNLWCSTTIAQASDRNMKENIVYLDDEIITTSLDEAPKNKFKDFIRDFKFATFNYKGSDGRSFGFIAQDVVENEISQYFIREVPIEVINKKENKVEGVENSLCFGLADYTSVIAKALQEEIREKDEKIKSLENRLSKLEQLINGLPNK